MEVNPATGCLDDTYLSWDLLFRCSIAVKHEDGDIIGTGDHPNRKSAETLAALSALYQLDAIGAVCTSLL